MAGRNTAAGQAFLNEVLAKHVPAENRAAVEALLGIESVVGAIGDGVLRQADYTRLSAQAQTDIAANVQWRADHLPVVEKAQQIVTKLGRTLEDPLEDIITGNDNRGIPANFDPVKLVEDVQARVMAKVGEVVDQRERGAAQFIAAVTDLSNKHFQTFGKPLDTSALIADPRTYQIGLEATYQQTYADQFTAKSEAELAAKLATAREEGRVAGVQETQSKFAGSISPTAALSSRNPVMASLEESRAASIGNPTETAFRPFTNRVDEAGLGVEYQRLVQAGVGVGQ